MVEQAGSLAGFAAVIGLAVLSALYFSQARDLRRLREWAGRAPERAADGVAGTSPVPGRVVAVPQRQTQANGDAAPTVAATPAAEGKGGEEPKAAEDAKAGEEKPGMPAPASAAAAAASAGAGAASVTGPAAPEASAPVAAPAGSAPAGSAPAPAPAAPAAAGSAAPSPPAPGAPKATPQRPPGSVLPPRTGTLPPVRRLPSPQTGPSPAATGVLGQAPQQKKPRNPLYIALAVAGVLVIGAAAAVGVPAIVNGSKNSKHKNAAATTKKSHSHRTHPTAVSAPNKITVAVLNGTSIPGLAAQVGDRVSADGFTLGTVSNAPQGQGQRANSVAMYGAGHAGDARLVARKLGIHNVQAVDASSQQIAGNASVVVIVGSDKTQ